jgi:Subtilase family
MPVDPRMRAQVELILNTLPDAAAFPDPEQWEEVEDVDYLYRRHTILVRERDANRLVEALARIFDRPVGEYRRQSVTAGVLRITLPGGLGPVPEVLDRLDENGLRGVGRIDSVVYVCPHPCPATEPIEVPRGTVTPFPTPGFDAGCCQGHCIPRPGCDGEGVFVSVVDTGLLRDVAIGHPWLVGVQGREEYPIARNGYLRPYAGHGTFVAGCLRCAAPKASVFVEKGFEITVGGEIVDSPSGSTFESDLAKSLEDALDRSPDVLVFTFTTSNRQNQSLHTFDDIYERRIRDLKGLVVVAPAGNDGQRRPMFPAAYPWVVSVGALSASWRDRAYFSNFGGWVDVFAPGQDLVNAFPEGTYVTKETPVPERRQFHGMAQWSGTSFSTPIVAGLIAARMSATGENGLQAAESLLRLARSQAIPGVGAALYPGQACCEAGHRHHQVDSGRAKPSCGCTGHTLPRG